MKVIGIDGQGNYIATVSHSELEKLSDKYYGKTKLEKLAIGSEFNLGQGYDFRESISRACKEMVNASKQFKDAQSSMLKFSSMVIDLPFGEEVTE